MSERLKVMLISLAYAVFVVLLGSGAAWTYAMVKGHMALDQALINAIKASQQQQNVE